MRVKLEDVCERGSSNVKQSDIPKNKGLYEIYGASGLAGKVDFYHRDKPYVAVIKDGAGIGRTMFLHGKTSVIGTLQYLIPKDNILPKYLYYVVKYMNLSKYFTGATIPHIYYRDYKNEEFNLSSIDGQKTIVNQLEALECIIELRTEELKKLDGLVKARFVEMFGESNCETKKLSEITDIITKGTTPTTAGFEFTNDGVNFFKIESITEDHTINLNKVAYVSDECHATLKRSQLRAGDVLFSIAGAIGRTAIIGPDDLPGNTNQALAIIRLSDNSGISQKYLISALDSPEVFEQCRTKKRGVAQINLSLQDVGNIEIPIPNLDDQKAFESFTKQVDKSKFALQNSRISLMNLWYNIN